MLMVFVHGALHEALQGAIQACGNASAGGVSEARQGNCSLLLS